MGRHEIAIAAARGPVRRGGQFYELLVVLVILGLLSAIALAGLARMKAQAARVACEADVRATAAAAELYAAGHTHYPATVAMLHDGGYLAGGSSSEHRLTYTPAADGTSFRLTGTMEDGTICAESART